MEILTVLRNGFGDLKKKIEVKINNLISEEIKKKKSKRSKIILKSLNKSKREIKGGIEKQYTSTKKVVEEIFNNKNIYSIDLTDRLINLGLKRALLLRAPYTPLKTVWKTTFEKDQDCVAFESVLDSLEKIGKKFKNFEMIFCVDDSDYFENDKKEKLHEEIVNDLKSKCSKIQAFTSPLDMLDSEFKEEYTKEQREDYETLADSIRAEAGGLWTGFSESTSRSSLSNRGNDQISSLSFSTSTSSSRLEITGDTKYCLKCGNNIESSIKAEHLGYLLGQFPFDCPFCHKQYMIKI